MLRTLPLCLTLLLLPVLSLVAGDKGDGRLGKPKDYNGYFPWTPPKTLQEWQKRREFVKAQVLVANGLWPMPEKTPLNAVIHGKIDRPGYTVEKVFFASYPGHHVTGNLYRPVGKTGKMPGVLFPHGHWAEARLSEFSKNVAGDLKSGAEKTKESSTYFFQALCAQLARMGCVVFHYDMVGYCDSKQIGHRQGFLDAEAELQLQSFMGLQTWNSIRALDFLVSLPDVDPARIGCTGASGGGTQTFILAAIDERVTAAFPAVMVSTGMQGGCICENCTYLRVGTGNIELAGLIAPRPLAMSGANDWTKHIEKDGLPQLKSLYSLYNAGDKVDAKAWLQFGHNYNQVAREFMYSWFNKHLQLGQKEPVEEQPFIPVPPKELRVYDAEHPLPKTAVDSHALRRYLTRASERQLRALYPDSSKKRADFQKVVGTALRVMIHDELPAPRDIEVVEKGAAQTADSVTSLQLVVRRNGTSDRVPILALVKKGTKPTSSTIWVEPASHASLKKDGKLVPAAQKLLDAGQVIVAVDVLLTGDSKGSWPPVNKGYAGYTWGYNRPLLAERIRDILTAVAATQAQPFGQKINLVGFGAAGPWVALARPLCGDAVARTAADLNRFRFEEILSVNDENLLPGALKYGGLTVLASLSAPHPLLLHNNAGGDPHGWLAASYNDSKQLDLRSGPATPEEVVNWLLR